VNEQQKNSAGTTEAHSQTFIQLPELEPRDYLYALKLDFDIDSQLIAIRGLLNRNQKATAERAVELRAIEDHIHRVTGIHADWAVDDWVDHLHHSTYQGAAHSMSAVGMLAPLVEAIFYQCLRGIGNRFFSGNRPARSHSRWNAIHAIQWDCRWFIDEKRPHKKAIRDVVRGILQLSDAIGLKDRLPADIEPTLSALFAYRNSMFHNGFEWPTEERDRFAKRIESKGWPHDWFSVATSDNEPWIFNLSDKFVLHCLTTIDGALDTIGVFIRDELLPKEEAS